MVAATNTSQEQTDVTVAAGSDVRSRDVLKPGKSWKLSFTAAGHTVEAGEVTVTASGVSTGHEHKAADCR